MNELIGGCLIAPSGQELQPTAAATQWAEVVGRQEVSPEAWASIGVSVNQQVSQQGVGRPIFHFHSLQGVCCNTLSLTEVCLSTAKEGIHENCPTYLVFFVIKQ